MKVQNIKLAIKAIEDVLALVEAPDVSWEIKYDLVFSDVGSKYVLSLLSGIGITLDFNEPDTSYEDDVLYFARRIEGLLPELKNAVKAIENKPITIELD
jgi:hypothetical protein